VALARAAKVAVVFAGLPDSYESEGYDRTHMRIPDCQVRVIEAVAAANPNTVVVLHNGAPVEMPWIHKVRAVLEAYLGGQAVGLATVGVLFGDVNPSGHLAESFPLRLQDTPCYLYYGGEGNTAEYREGVFVGYRYYDKREMDVLFPFGHGLSYTTFEYADLRLSADRIRDTESLTATVTVKNTGRRAGKTVVQLYVRAGAGEVIRPVRELKGFEKVELQPGEAKDVSFTLDKRAFAYWNMALGDWHVETGDYTVEVGQSSRRIDVSAPVRVESTVQPPVRYDENSIFMDLLKDPKATEVLKPLTDALSAVFRPNADEDTPAGEAISNEMTTAMLNYMPLRGMLSFGGNQLPAGFLEELLARLKG